MPDVGLCDNKTIQTAYSLAGPRGLYGPAKTRRNYTLTRRGEKQCDN